MAICAEQELIVASFAPWTSLQRILGCFSELASGDSRVDSRRDLSAPFAPVAPYAEQEAHIFGSILEAEKDWVKERLREAPPRNAPIQESDCTHAECYRCHRCEVKTA